MARKVSQFAVRYNMADLIALTDGLGRLQTGGAGITNADRNDARALWNGGLSNWQLAQVYTGPEAGGDPDCRQLIVVGGSRNLATLIALIRKYALTFNQPYLLGLARDLGRSDGGKDPWP